MPWSTWGTTPSGTSGGPGASTKCFVSLLAPRNLTDPQNFFCPQHSRFLDNISRAESSSAGSWSPSRINAPGSVAASVQTSDLRISLTPWTGAMTGTASLCDAGIHDHPAVNDSGKPPNEAPRSSSPCPSWAPRTAYVALFATTMRFDHEQHRPHDRDERALDAERALASKAFGNALCAYNCWATRRWGRSRATVAGASFNSFAATAVLLTSARYGGAFTGTAPRAFRAGMGAGQTCKIVSRPGPTSAARGRRGCWSSRPVPEALKYGYMAFSTMRPLHRQHAVGGQPLRDQLHGSSREQTPSPSQVG